MASSSHRLYLISMLVNLAFFVFGEAQTVNITSSIYLRYGERGHLADFYIGTPPRRITVTFDTGSNLFWVKSRKPFDPKSSSSIAEIPCHHCLCKPVGKMRVGCENTCTFEQRYGDETWLRGFMASETFNLGDTWKGTLVFGYTTELPEGMFDDRDGIMGFARGELSFLAQLGVSKFSYCLTNGTTQTRTPILLGDQAVIKPNLKGVAKSIPLIRSPGDPSHYYVDLEGITIGDIRVDIPLSSFQVNKTALGGVLLDVGSQAILLAPDVYPKVMKAFADQLNAQDAWDEYLDRFDFFELPNLGHSIDEFTGFYTRMSNKSVRNELVPKLILHFKGGIDFDVPKDNYVKIENFLDGDWRHISIMNSDMEGVSLLGNLFQQNMQVLYDLKRERVWFAPTDCSQF